MLAFAWSPRPAFFASKPGCALLCGLFALGSGALAHDSVTPATFWSAWNLNPVTLLGLALVGLVYSGGLGRLWARAGVGKGVTLWQAAAFAGGLYTLFVALVSPLDALGHTLFSAHMAQHMLLVLVAAPLLVFASPVLPALWALPAKNRRKAGRAWRRAGGLRWLGHLLGAPLVVWCLFAVTLWVWHLPGLYQAAVASPWVHVLEHLSLLAAASLFWWAVIQPLGRRRLNYGAAILFVFTTSVHKTVLGTLFLFAPATLYPVYEAGAAAWGLTPLADQQMAGMIMRTPGTFIFLFACGALFLLWLRQMEKRASPRGTPEPSRQPSQ